MSSNILGLNPFQPHPIAIITNKICQVLDKNYSQDNHIEIQFKYAEFTTFCNSFYEKQQMPNQIRKKVMDICSYFVLEQNRLHFQTLKKLSCNGLIHLNPLGNRVYKLYGGFDQNIHKKFYKIREFLMHLCKQNQQNLVNNLNFYREIQLISNNRSFKIINSNEVRLDVNIKQGQHAGRFSYAVGEGWTKTIKQNLIRQDFDLMMAQKTFRLGIKKQIQVPVTFEQVLEALNDPATEKGGIFMRFKRALRVTKNNEVEIALSEVYQPEPQRRAECLIDLKDMLTFQAQVLDQFCQNVFQQFYMWQDPKPNQIKFFGDAVNKYEIQSQFMPAGVRKLIEFQKSKNYRQLDKYVQTNLQDLYALSFVDHNVKKREVKIINEIIKQKYQGQKKYPECRLQNQFGTYMHDLVYEYMMDN